MEVTGGHSHTILVPEREPRVVDYVLLANGEVHLHVTEGRIKLEPHEEWDSGIRIRSAWELKGKIPGEQALRHLNFIVALPL